MFVIDMAMNEWPVSPREGVGEGPALFVQDGGTAGVNEGAEDGVVGDGFGSCVSFVCEDSRDIAPEGMSRHDERPIHPLPFLVSATVKVDEREASG